MTLPVNAPQYTLVSAASLFGQKAVAGDFVPLAQVIDYADRVTTPEGAVRHMWRPRSEGVPVSFECGELLLVAGSVQARCGKDHHVRYDRIVARLFTGPPGLRGEKDALAELALCGGVA